MRLKFRALDRGGLQTDSSEGDSRGMFSKWNVRVGCEGNKVMKMLMYFVNLFGKRLLST